MAGCKIYHHSMNIHVRSAIWKRIGIANTHLKPRDWETNWDRLPLSIPVRIGKQHDLSIRNFEGFKYFLLDRKLDTGIPKTMGLEISYARRGEWCPLCQTACTVLRKMIFEIQPKPSERPVERRLREKLGMIWALVGASLRRLWRQDLINLSAKWDGLIGELTTEDICEICEIRAF